MFPHLIKRQVFNLHYLFAGSPPPTEVMGTIMPSLGTAVRVYRSRTHSLFALVKRRGFYLNEPFFQENPAVPFQLPWDPLPLPVLLPVVLLLALTILLLTSTRRKQKVHQLRAGPKRSPRDHLPSKGFLRPLVSHQTPDGPACSRDLNDSFADEDDY